MNVIQIGAEVDDGKGDYLRQGGDKINKNFAEIYTDLGDGTIPHPAGAWRTIKSTTGVLIKPIFGQSLAIDTSSVSATVILPLGSPSDYGKVVKLRDVWGTWRQNPVTIQPSGGNTIKGGATTKQLSRDLQDVELVFTSPSDWEYLDNKSVDRLSQSDISTVSKKEIVATEGQTDFVNIFGDSPYNSNNMEVYRRGNMLYYGDKFSSDSNYGSIGKASATEITELDNHTIRLRNPCVAGDVVTFVTYLDGLAVHRTSYVSKTITVYDGDASEMPSIPGVRWVGDLNNKTKWTFADFGLNVFDGTLNPHSTEVLINGSSLTMAGRGDLPVYDCEDGDGQKIEGRTEVKCIANGGSWVDSGVDFSILEDEDGRTTIIKIYEIPEDGDLLTVRWYNNDIGTTMDIEDIKKESDKLYLNNQLSVNRSKKLRYNDYSNPNPCTTEIETEVETNIRLTDVSSLLETIYPIGTIYMNAHNKNNPSMYMGFGTWVSYAEGQSIVGWEDGTSSHFSYYDGSCGRSVSPGGSGGEINHTLLPTEIPSVGSGDEVLIKDANGDVVIGQCQLDPDDEGPGYRTYREGKLNSNVHTGTSSFPVLQPYVTVAAWLRVA